MGIPGFRGRLISIEQPSLLQINMLPREGVLAAVATRNCTETSFNIDGELKELTSFWL